MWRWAPYRKAVTKTLLQRLAELEQGGEHKTLHPRRQVVAKRRRDLSEWFSPGLSGAVIVGGVGLLVCSWQVASSADPGSRTSSLPVGIFRVSSLSRPNAP